MITTLRHILAAGALVAAGPALACSPAMNAAAQSVAGANCALRHDMMPIGADGLTEAEDVRSGFVTQLHFDGNACYVAEARVILDCLEGQALLFGPAAPMSIEDHLAATEGAYGQLFAEYTQTPVSLDVLEEVAGEEGLKVTRIASLAAPVVLGQSGKPFDLACGCRLFYPDSKGARG